MLLVADSGSTKCDWILGTKAEQKRISTIGFNPLFHTSDFITDEIVNNNELAAKRHHIKTVYFYGASVSSDERRKTVEVSLKTAFPNAKIKADHDLMGAALATCGFEPGIACILGTGSNSCYFDGTTVVEKIPALGYILGDEGSGAHFGKLFLKKYLYKELPYAINRELEILGIDKDVIFKKVYQESAANVYLPSFMKTIYKFRQDPVIAEMLHSGFTEFLQIHVCKFDNYSDVDTHFVGSVSLHFQEEIAKACKALNINPGFFTNDPISRLFGLHAGELESY